MSFRQKLLLLFAATILFCVAVMSVPVYSTMRHSFEQANQDRANAVAAEMQRRQIAVRTLTAPLRPLGNIIGAAIAVEVAPQGADSRQLTAPDYQQLVTSAVATAIAATRDQLGGAR